MIKENRDILEDLNLPLPSKLKNQKIEDIRIFQQSAGTQLYKYGDKLKNSATFYTEKGVIKAKTSKKDLIQILH